MPRLPPTPRPSWYELHCAEPPLGLPPLRGRVDTAVCVVGGGLAGLATLLSLRERGVHAVLLEAGAVGGGGSGRNGGMATGGFALDASALERRVGRPHAQQLHAASVEGLELVRRRIRDERLAVPVTNGVLVASFFDSTGLPDEIRRMNTHYGTRLAERGRGWMRDNYRTERYTGGIFDPEGFHLDPLALARGYARAAIRRGAVIHEGSPVLALAGELAGNGWVVRAGGGEVRARQVVLATSVGGAPLRWKLQGALVPVATFIIVTEPLGARLGEVIAPPYAVYDDRFATGYYRPLPDGRLLWGGRIARTETVRDLEGLMRQDLLFVYPQFAEVRVDAAWGGLMAIARHRMPLLGELQAGLWMATGFAGHGLNTTSMAGEIVADALAGTDRRHELFAPFRPRATWGPLGQVAAQAIYQGHSWRDRWRLRQNNRRRRA